MEVLDDNDTNWLILTDSGTETKSKSSDLNKLLFGHNLFGLLDRGDEIWSKDGRDDEPSVTLIPDENAECYTIHIEDAPDLHLGAQHKTDLVDAMASIYEDFDGESVRPLLRLYEDIRENMVREHVLEPFLDMFGDKVVGRDDGWFINGHLLLNYEGEFYHPNNLSRNRQGGIIGEGTSVEAYNVNIDTPDSGMQRGVTVDGTSYRLTDSEVDFLARAMWGVQNTPDRR